MGRRRKIQEVHNLEYNITPKSIVKAIHDIMVNAYKEDEEEREELQAAEEAAEYFRDGPDKIAKKLKALEKEMYRLARDLVFEKAAKIRDQILNRRYNNYPRMPTWGWQ
jgi:excinuclease ABC subunit B